ncbi:hypothetical protein QFZ26_000055 [Agromyces ramosus]|uniref:AbiEi antitoxin C-terminal domain-containing protein n=1 Tax=Agromyces ramosus TaxID=33879 RepID=A0ABU0R336_9MICO|nr:hypothetical protein [Agromyces ramosus]
MLQHGLMARLPTVLGTHDLPLAELCAARIDGELVAIDDGWAPIDEPDLPSLRAAVVALRVPRSLIIERRSAAWVHGALDAPPAIAQFCVPHHERIAAISDRRTHVREVTLSDGDVDDYRGARCTSVSRTAFDLLRDPSPVEGDTVAVVTRLLRGRPDVTEAVRLRLDSSRRMPHRARAVDRLDRASALATSSPGTPGAQATRGRSAVADAVDVVHRVDAAHGVEHAVEVGGVAHLEDEAAERESIGRGRDVRREDVHVMLREHASDV